MSLAKLNLRFAHFPSRAPIMLEFPVDRATTVGQLRALVEEKLATEDHCLVRVFARWYLETRAGEVRRFSELTDADVGSVLSAVGIEDECELYLEGPVIEAEQNSIGKALAIVSVQGRQAQTSFMSELRALKEMQVAQADATANLNQKLDKLALQVEAIVATQERQQQLLKTTADTQTKQGEALSALRCEIMAFDSQILNRANWLLIKHSSLPLRALWEVLNDKGSSVELAMAIVLDRRCGLERRSTWGDGTMVSWNGFVLNMEAGGLTPLIMATLASRVDVMKALLAAGAIVDAKDDGDRAAIYITTITNDPSAIELLVSYGADVNICRSGGYSPLQNATYCGHLEAIEMLIAKGADITKADIYGDIPLKIFTKRQKQFTNKPQEVKARVRKLLTPK